MFASSFALVLGVCLITDGSTAAEKCAMFRDVNALPLMSYTSHDHIV